MLLQQLLRDIEDEMLWVAEKEPLAASQDLGASLTAVQNLQKKHQVCLALCIWKLTFLMRIIHFKHWSNAQMWL